MSEDENYSLITLKDALVRRYASKETIMKLNNHGMGDYTLELTKQELICLRSLVHVSGERAANANDKHSVMIATWALRALCNAGVDVNMGD